MQKGKVHFVGWPGLIGKCYPILQQSVSACWSDRFVKMESTPNLKLSYHLLKIHVHVGVVKSLSVN